MVCCCVVRRIHAWFTGDNLWQHTHTHTHDVIRFIYILVAGLFLSPYALNGLYILKTFMEPNSSAWWHILIQFFFFAISVRRLLAIPLSVALIPLSVSGSVSHTNHRVICYYRIMDERNAMSHLCHLRLFYMSKKRTGY